MRILTVLILCLVVAVALAGNRGGGGGGNNSNRSNNERRLGFFERIRNGWRLWRLGLSRVFGSSNGNRGRSAPLRNSGGWNSNDDDGGGAAPVRNAPQQVGWVAVRVPIPVQNNAQFNNNNGGGWGSNGGAVPAAPVRNANNGWSSNNDQDRRQVPEKLRNDGGGWGSNDVGDNGGGGAVPVRNGPIRNNNPGGYSK